MKTAKKSLIASFLFFLLILLVWIKIHAEDNSFTSFTFAHIGDTHMFASGNITDEQGNNASERLAYAHTLWQRP